MSVYEWDTSCADLELDRLRHGFTAEDHAAFAGVFLANFGQAVASIHIETGSLLGSAKADIEHSSGQRWEAQMSFGGSSGGVKNPVRYAVSELFGRSPKHGGPPNHDYLRHTAFIDQVYVAAVDAFFDRGHHTPHPEGLRR